MHATPSSDGFCAVRDMTRDGRRHSGYERSNGEVRRVQVGDWLLRVYDISCQDTPRGALPLQPHVAGPSKQFINHIEMHTILELQRSRTLELQPSHHL